MTEQLAAVPAQRTLPADGPTLAELAAATSATDVLVFRQVTPGRYLQIGGHGRGAGWAGNIDLTVEDDVALRRAAAGGLVTWSGDSPQQVMGPYYARSAALVPVDHDLVVLFGSTHGDLSSDEAVLREAAHGAANLVEAITPAKALADELELLHAVRAVMQCGETHVHGVLEHVARTAAEALSCEVAAIYLPAQDELVVVERDWRLNADREEVRAAMAQVLVDVGLQETVCRQSSAEHPLPEPLGPEHGAQSHLVVPLGPPANGLLVLLHTGATPRGFTSLCQVVGEKVGEAAGVVVHSSVLRAELEQLVLAAEAAARRDALTGLGNRLAWEEAVATCDGSAPVSVVVVDVNGLKAMNDEHGHAAGDAYLQLCASALRAAVRDGDVAARLGGDEFALLLPGLGAVAAHGFVSRLTARVGDAGSVRGVPLSAAIGYATAEPGESVDAAVQRADARMYENKAGTR
ncbi:MAG: Diguanylate cyclase with sensor [Frankiales bacterium]|nr:Diguanylate cyclase with sensor [Frankiales bacterium]